jgi:hypothetical protein
MAYNPGVSDISGQIRARGMTSGFNSLLEGFDAGVKTYQQNKQIADTSIADFGAAVANSESLKALLADEEQRATLPSDVVKAYIKLNKEGSLGAREAALLGGFARSYTKNEEDSQQRKLRDAQMAQIAQQSAIAQQASSIAQAQNTRQQAEFSAMEDMNKKFRDLAALGAGGSPNDAEPEEYADIPAAQKRQREYEAAQAFLNSSAGKYVAAGGVLTPQLTAQLNIADQTSNTRMSVAEIAAQKAAEQYRLRAEAAEARLNRNPVPEIVDIDLAVENGEITREMGDQLKQAIRVKKGTIPESQEAMFRRVVNEPTGAGAGGAGAAARGAAVTPKTEATPPLKPVGSSEADRRRIPLGTQFMTNEDPPRLMYKDKNGNFGFGPLPTK